jgi:hypothetical protein
MLNIYYACEFSLLIEKFYRFKYDHHTMALPSGAAKLKTGGLKDVEIRMHSTSLLETVIAYLKSTQKNQHQ